MPNKKGKISIGFGESIILIISKIGKCLNYFAILFHDSLCFFFNICTRNFCTNFQTWKLLSYIIIITINITLIKCYRLKTLINEKWEFNSTLLRNNIL